MGIGSSLVFVMHLVSCGDFVVVKRLFFPVLLEPVKPIAKQASLPDRRSSGPIHSV